MPNKKTMMNLICQIFTWSNPKINRVISCKPVLFPTFTSHVSLAYTDAESTY